MANGIWIHFGFYTLDSTSGLVYNAMDGKLAGIWYLVILVFTKAQLNKMVFEYQCGECACVCVCLWTSHSSTHHQRVLHSDNAAV